MIGTEKCLFFLKAKALIFNAFKYTMKSGVSFDKPLFLMLILKCISYKVLFIKYIAYDS